MYTQILLTTYASVMVLGVLFDSMPYFITKSPNPCFCRCRFTCPDRQPPANNFPNFDKWTGGVHGYHCFMHLFAHSFWSYFLIVYSSYVFVNWIFADCFASWSGSSFAKCFDSNLPINSSASLCHTPKINGLESLTITMEVGNYTNTCGKLSVCNEIR